MYKLHVIDNPNCSSCNVIENCNHYFIECPMYQVQRISLFSDIERYCTVSTNVLLYGNDSLSVHDNLQICKAVEEFIASSERFNWFGLSLYLLFCAKIHVYKYYNNIVKCCININYELFITSCVSVCVWKSVYELCVQYCVSYIVVGEGWCRNFAMPNPVSCLNEIKYV